MGDRSPKDAEKRKKKVAKDTQAAPPRPDIIVKSAKASR